MEELKNYAELSFSNPILLDVFGNYMENSVLASFVTKTGVINLKFKVNPPVEPPKNCEQILSLLFALLESNSDVNAVGKAYSAKRLEIMRDTILRLSQMLDGFINVKLILHTTEQSPDSSESEITKHTEFTFDKTKSSNTVIK